MYIKICTFTCFLQLMWNVWNSFPFTCANSRHMYRVGRHWYHLKQAWVRKCFIQCSRAPLTSTINAFFCNVHQLPCNINHSDFPISTKQQAPRRYVCYDFYLLSAKNRLLMIVKTGIDLPSSTWNKFSPTKCLGLKWKKKKEKNNSNLSSSKKNSNLSIKINCQNVEWERRTKWKIPQQ